MFLVFCFFEEKLVNGKYLFGLLAASVFLVTAGSASAAFQRLSCDDYSNSGASMWARYIDSGERRTLDVVLKVPATAENRGESVRSVLIGVANVGKITLQPNAEGMLSGSLSYDSYSDRGDANPGVFAFPANWTGAVSGNQVRTAGLACVLAD